MVWTRTMLDIRDEWRRASSNMWFPSLAIFEICSRAEEGKSFNNEVRLWCYCPTKILQSIHAECGRPKSPTELSWITVLKVWLLQLKDPTGQKVLKTSVHEMVKKLGGTYQICLFHIVKKTLNALSMSSSYDIFSVLLLHRKIWNLKKVSWFLHRCIFYRS